MAKSTNDRYPPPKTLTAKFPPPPREPWDVIDDYSPPSSSKATETAVERIEREVKRKINDDWGGPPLTDAEAEIIKRRLSSAPGAYGYGSEGGWPFTRSAADFILNDDDANRRDREALKRPRFKPWSYDEFKGMQPRQWRVGSKTAPLLIDKGLWATFGLYKSAKTYYSLDQAFCIAHGKPFLGHDTIQGNVAYLLAEGGVQSAYERLQALCAKHEMSEADALDSGRFNLITSAVNFTNTDAPDGYKELMRQLERIEPRVVYLDTWMRMLSASGGHDSDPQTVGRAIAGCDRIIADLDCTAVLCAHVGHSEQWRMKGMIDLEGAIDGATFCEKIGEGAGAEFHFKSVFQRHALDGYEIVAGFKTFGPDAALVAKAARAVNLSKLSPDHRPVYEKLLELFRLAVPDDGGIEGIAVAAWRDAVDPAAMWPGVANPRKKWADAKEAIEKAGLITITKDQVYLVL